MSTSPIPEDLLRRLGLTLLPLDGASIRVASPRRLSGRERRELQFAVGASVEVVVDASVGDGARTPAVPAQPVQPVQSTAKRKTLELSGSVVQQVDRMLAHAVSVEASDVHVEPYEHFFRLRFRLDGVLHTVGELPLLQRAAFVSRIKVMANLDIAERRRPQDGRMRFTTEGRTIDLRVSTLPTHFGEKVVLRLLDKAHLALRLDALGLQGTGLDLVRRAIGRPHGMVLVTGPTGSGKTTTLYAALSERNTDDVNVITVEDPIEYDLPGINQTHVRADIGFTFANALRAFLRQDPDVIMVGEVRDAETAQVAVRAALTGHLVFSTLHTNDAPSAVTRLADMGVEPYLVASSLRLVVAQRLLRRVCTACRQPSTPSPQVLTELGLSSVANGTYVEGKGCDVCSGTGYKGRLAVFEVMEISDDLRDLIATRVPAQRVRAQAESEGLQSLRSLALRVAALGKTTLAEVLRCTS